MNEVRPTQVTSTAVSPVTRAASSKPSSDDVSLKELPSVDKELPVEKEKETSTIGNIEQAVIEINSHVQSVQRDLHFSVDEDSGLTVIRVHDKASGDLIRQIPEDVFLSLAQKLNEDQSIHLFDAHG